jgi:hypothetical protein
MLLLPVLEKEENENDGVDGLLLLWRKREKQLVERESVVERVVVKLVMRVLVAAVGCWDDAHARAHTHTHIEREREREREREKVAGTGKRLIFWLTLDPIFFLFRP